MGPGANTSPQAHCQPSLQLWPNVCFPSPRTRGLASETMEILSRECALATDWDGFGGFCLFICDLGITALLSTGPQLQDSDPGSCEAKNREVTHLVASGLSLGQDTYPSGILALSMDTHLKLSDSDIKESPVNVDDLS